MKKHIFALAGACLVTLAACDDKSPPPEPNRPVIIDDAECPRPDGEPCR